MATVHVLAPEALTRAAADTVADAARRVLERRARFTLALTGGSTPRPIYEWLVRAHAGDVDWDRVHIFWGDERCVPPDDPASNYRMARESLLERVPVPAENVYRIRGELAPAEAAAAYSEELGELFRAARPGECTRPAFDLVLLGIGTDGHTASLFPDSPALEADDWAVGVEAPPEATPRRRVTLTLAALDTARDVVFLATGGEKRAAVRAALTADAKGAKGASVPPAGRVRPRGTTTWFLDKAAAHSNP